jgi:hypothetical protein
MTEACQWGVESGQLIYPSMFGHVQTCVYVNYRSNESVHFQAAEEDGRTMSDKNFEQWINIQFSMKSGKNASETLPLLTMVYGKYTMRYFLNGRGSSGKRKMSSQQDHDCVSLQSLEDSSL